jgi:hypothetical protein
MDVTAFVADKYTTLLPVRRELQGKAFGHSGRLFAGPFPVVGSNIRVCLHCLSKKLSRVSID